MAAEKNSDELPEKAEVNLQPPDPPSLQKLQVALSKWGT